jgi:hypothetical protein
MADRLRVSSFSSRLSLSKVLPDEAAWRGLRWIKDTVRMVGLIVDFNPRRCGISVRAEPGLRWECSTTESAHAMAGCCSRGRRGRRWVAQGREQDCT